MDNIYSSFGSEDRQQSASQSEINETGSAQGACPNLFLPSDTTILRVNSNVQFWGRVAWLILLAAIIGIAYETYWDPTSFLAEHQDGASRWLRGASILLFVGLIVLIVLHFGRLVLSNDSIERQWLIGKTSMPISTVRKLEWFAGEKRNSKGQPYFAFEIRLSAPIGEIIVNPDDFARDDAETIIAYLRAKIAEELQSDSPQFMEAWRQRRRLGRFQYMSREESIKGLIAFLGLFLFFITAKIATVGLHGWVIAIVFGTGTLVCLSQLIVSLFYPSADKPETHS